MLHPAGHAGATLRYKPGRQTLSITGLRMEGVGGLAIDATASVSLVDSTISCTGGGGGISAGKSAGLLLKNVWFNRVATAVRMADGTPVAGNADGWVQFTTVAAPVAAGVGSTFATTPVYTDGLPTHGPVVVKGATGTPPPADLTEQHSWAAAAAADGTFPSWESVGACFAADYGVLYFLRCLFAFCCSCWDSCFCFASRAAARCQHVLAAVCWCWG